MNRYSSLGAEMSVTARPAGFSLIDIVIRPRLTFFYNYFLRDFQIASIEWVLGPILALGGFVFGLQSWVAGLAHNTPATAGTVMIAALPIIVGVQMLLGALNYDIQNTPQRPLHPALDTGTEPTAARLRIGAPLV